LEYYKKSARKEYSTAQNILGYLYENGEDTKRNLEKAFEYYNKAVEMKMNWHNIILADVINL